MSQFTDHAGRTWNPHVTLDVLANVERALNIGCLAIFADPARVHEEFFGRVGVMVPLFYYAVKPEATARNMDYDAVAAMLAESGNFSKATAALAEDMTSFFQSLNGVPAETPAQGARSIGETFRSWLRSLAASRGH